MRFSDPFARHPRFLARLPRLVRFYILNCVIGFALSGFFTGMVLWLDLAGIGGLVARVDGGWLAALVFFAFNGIVFAGVQSGVAVTLMAEGAQEPPGGGRLAPAFVPVAVPAETTAAGR